jgi:hypothetical protein
MLEIMVHPPLLSCYHLFSRLEAEEFQWLGPDLFLTRARDARGR